MKSKKPFLIVCAVAVTLSLALPFMGVFAFAEDSVSVSIDMTSGTNISVSYVPLSGGNASTASRSGDGSTSVPFVFVPGVVYQLSPSMYYNSQWRSCTLLYNSSSLSQDSSNPTVITEPVSSFKLGQGSGTSLTYYVMVELPPDPLAPVSDGMDTMISVFGDVIDYIINTPDVSIFVAISVASCAIIPMGIILIKKLIKGY